MIRTVIKASWEAVGAGAGALDSAYREVGGSDQDAGDTDEDEDGHDGDISSSV